MFCLFKYLHVRTFVWCFLLWSTRGTCAVWTEASSSTVTHHSTVLKRRVRCTSHLHLNKPYFCLMLEQTIKSHTHNYKPTLSWVTECRQTPELWVSSGIGPLGQLRYEPGDGSSRRMPHWSPRCSNTHTHTERETTHVPTCTKAD